MPAELFRLEDVPEDAPIPLLFRKRVVGDKILLAHVRLQKGCQVALHHHENEQVAYIVSGKLKWTLGAEGSTDRQEVVAEGGTVIHLPSNFPHAVEALEDSLVLDILSPPGEMGVDRQKD